jgi:hypothetical protein
MTPNPYTTFRTFRTKIVLDGHPKTQVDVAGAVTACCEVDLEKKSMKVGFSFMNPCDPLFKVRGRGKAVSRLEHFPVVITGLEPAQNGKLQVTEALLKYLREVVKQPTESIPELLGVKEYRGEKTRSEFMKWFPSFVAALVP